MTPQQILRDAWYFYSRNFLQIALLCGPLMLLEALSAHYWESLSGSKMGMAEGLLVALMFSPLYQAVLIYFMASRSSGEPLNAGQLYSAALRIWPLYALLISLGLLLKGLGLMMLIVPGIWIAVKLSFADYLENTYTDGVIVLLDGKVVYQRYFGMPEEQPHIMWSMTKSMIGLIATQLIHEGRLDPDAPVTDYLPELADSGWKGATVQQVLNMTADVSYSEVYADAESDVVKYAMAAGMSPVPADYAGARNLYDYLPSIPGKGNHGREFQYRTVHTEVLGWILRRVTGQNSAQMIGERIWSPLGTEHEAYMLLDPAGTEWAGAGMNASLRDLARFGEMLRNDGAFNGREIVAPQVLASIREGADREQFKAAGRIGQDGYSYRNQFWISHNRDGAFELLGVHGQMIHVNPAAGLVLVRLSSHPVAASAAHFPTTRPAMEALAGLLRSRR